MPLLTCIQEPSAPAKLEEDTKPLAGPSEDVQLPSEVPSKRKAEEDPEDESENDDDDEPDYEDEPDRYPVSHEIMLKDHTKVSWFMQTLVIIRLTVQVTTCIAVDGAGARIATGSHDYDVKLWDFAGMDGRLKPFKTFEPAENYHVRAVSQC